MTTFVDTSAFLALLDADDLFHVPSAQTWRTLLDEDARLATSSYVIIETYALVQRRLGMEALRVFSQDFEPLLEVEWLGQEIHDAAVAALLTAGRRHLSLVDCVSFEIMRQKGINRVFAFDPDFADQGFDCLPTPSE